MLIYINNCVRAHGIFYQLCVCTVCFDAYNGKGVWTRKIMRFDMAASVYSSTSTSHICLPAVLCGGKANVTREA